MEKVHYKIINGDISEYDYKQIVTFNKGISIDTETTGLDPLIDKLCFIQIKADKEVYIIKYDTNNSYTHLKKLLSEVSITKYFHNAIFDMRFISKNLDLQIENIICTKIAAKFIYGNQDKTKTTLKFLAKTYADIELDKSVRMTDWNTMNLSEEQIQYVISDVLYLNIIWNNLEKILTNTNMLKHVNSCFDFLPTQTYLMNKNIDNIFEY